MIGGRLPPLDQCPFCKREVEIVTIQRDAKTPEVCVVSYYHTDGDRHFITYTPEIKREEVQ